MILLLGLNHSLCKGSICASALTSKWEVSNNKVLWNQWDWQDHKLCGEGQTHPKNADVTIMAAWAKCCKNFIRNAHQHTHTPYDSTSTLIAQTYGSIRSVAKLILTFQIYGSVHHCSSNVACCDFLWREAEFSLHVPASPSLCQH